MNFLLDVAKMNIEGEITIDEVEDLIAAHYKIGDIALVWGVAGKKGTKGGYGLAHIIRRRKELGQNLEAVLNEMEKVINEGTLERLKDGKFKLVLSDKTVILKPTFNEEYFQFVLTAYEKYKQKR